MGDKVGYKGLSFKAEKKVREIISDALGVKEEKVIPSAELAKDLGMDSLDFLQLVVRFQNAFDIGISDEEAVKFVTVRNVFEYLGNLHK